MQRKQNLASPFGIQKESWGVTLHFSEIRKLQFGTKTPHIDLYFTAVNYLSKMCGYPQFSFWISIALAKICFSRIVINRTKILWY